MVDRLYSVEAQRISCAGADPPATGQIAFVRCKFSFDDKWDGITQRIAQFTQGGKSYEQLLDNDNCCTLPHELIEGYCMVSVYGVSGDGMRATTAPYRDYIVKSGFAPDASASGHLTPDLFTQLIERVEKALSSAGSDGVGFDNWRYDEEGNLHILDKDGNDALPPLYVPGINQNVLSDEDIALAKSLLETARNCAEQAKQENESAATHSQTAGKRADEASLSAEAAASSAEEAHRAAAETKEYADLAVVLKSLGDLGDLSQSAEQAKLYARASQSYAQEAQQSSEAITAIHDSFSEDVASATAEVVANADRASAAAETATAAAQRSEAAITEAVDAVHAAKETAVETVRTESAPILREAADAAEQAESAKAAVEAAASSASTSASAAAESESKAEHYAEAAQQVAEKNGYLYFCIENGRLMETRTDNVEEDMIFTIEEGRLILTYE